MKKNYTITLDYEIVEEVKTLLGIGQKFSPIVNELIIQWVKKNKKKGKTPTSKSK